MALETPSLVSPPPARSRKSTRGAGWELAAVLDVLRQRGSATRPQIGQETGLSRAVVAQRLADLHATGVVVAAGSEVSTGGRPPKQVRFNAELGHLLVADLGATSIDVALANLLGQVLLYHSEPADIAAGPVAVLDRVEACFAELLAESGHGPGLLWGIGIGVPGPVEFSSGRPVAPPIMPGWDGYPIRERLSARFGAPVWVDNDVNVMALGERAEGTACGLDDVVFIKVGSGIGAGIISHGQLQRGAQGSAGDVGHIQVVSDLSATCRCGKVGCLEAVAGGAAVGRAAERAANAGGSPLLADVLHQHGAVSARDVAHAALLGDVVSTQLLQQAGRHIGQMLATVVNIVNPSLIVIGGGVAAAGDVFMASIREVVYGRSLPLATRHLQIRQSDLGEQAGIVGLASMVHHELFAPERVDSWIESGLPLGRPELASY